jgi:hypothetical protein
VLFNTHARAGDQIKLTSRTGAVCVDHTYGAFRGTEWAGPSVWTGRGARFGSGSTRLEGTVPTDSP